MERVVRAIVFSLLATAVSCGLPELPERDAFDAVVKDNPFVPTDNYLAGDGDAPAFNVSAIEPARGPINGGTRVELLGVGFVQGMTVVFGASEAVEVIFQNDGSILCSTPPGPAGPVDVSVVRPDGKFITLENGFFYETSITITGVEPDVGPPAGGTPIRVKGSGFLGDSALLVGGRPAVSWQFIDTETVVAIAPPGTPGPRDVTVFNRLGSATAKKAFTYVEPPSVLSCDPVVIFKDAGSIVTVNGNHLLGTTGVITSNGTAHVVETLSDSRLRVSLTPHAPGPVGLTVISPVGSSSLEACAWSIDPSASQSVPRILGVVPSSGRALGGYPLKVIVSGLDASWTDQTSVRLGGADAEVSSVAPDVGSGIGFLEVTAPQHAPGLVDCRLQSPGGDDVMAQAFRFLPDVVIDGVQPDFGPASGGTEVTITGSSLEQVNQVFVGPLPALIVAGPAPDSIRVVTAAANPGIHDVSVVTAWGERITIEDAFTFGAKEPGLSTIVPGSGSQAGGTLVSLVGSGLDGASQVSFGAGVAETVDATDPARMLVYSPPGSPGPVDVTVQWPDGTVKVLEDAFTYFDPTGYFGGVWGDMINGAVNVTVLDSYNGKPVQGAFVILGD
ncbi:MAG: hypothetical protein GXP54_03160, partial [Deltaproteobacteria bacterium]|nr:hypothetical protein [Deltaproteobacteria bacterium]